MDFTKIRLKKVIEWLLYLFIFLLPWQIRFIWRQAPVEYWRFSLYGTEVLLLFIILLYLIGELRFLLKLRNNYTYPLLNDRLIMGKKNLPFLLLLAWAGVSVIWSLDKTLASYVWLTLLEGVVFFFLIQTAALNYQRLAIAFVLGAVSQAGLAVSQFLLQDILVSGKWFGVAAKQASDLGVSVVEVASSRYLRAYGALPHPNILGGYLALALIFLAGLFSYQGLTGFPFITSAAQGSLRELNKRSNYSGRYKNYLKIFFLYGSLAVLTAGLFFTYSRSAWLALVLGLISLLILSRKKTLTSILKYLIVLLTVIVILSSLFWPPLATRLTLTDRLESVSIKERLTGYQQAEVIIKENFLLGAGLGNYTKALAAGYPLANSFQKYQPVHSVFLLVWSELGLIGLLLFISAIFYAWRQLLRDKSGQRHLILLPLLIALIVLLIFDHWLWSLYFGLMIFWLTLGIVARRVS